MKNPFQTTKIGRYIASIKLAIPLLCFLLICSVYGTLVEADFNAEIAKLKVYNAWYFQVLLGLLFLNIFSATLSRLPFKKHHTGFVITHIGLLTLLFGAFVTQRWGIDGSLQVQEGGKGDTLSLSELALIVETDKGGFTQVPFPRYLHEKHENDLSSLSDKMPYGMQILNYRPFVKPTEDDPALHQGTVQVLFGLKSAMFNVQQALNNADQSKISMGPATFELLPLVNFKPVSGAVKTHAKKVAPKASEDKTDVIEFFNVENGNILKTIKVKEFAKSGLSIQGLNVSLGQTYERASIVNNKIQDVDSGPANPALEIIIAKGAEKTREILYANFPDFTLIPKGVNGIKMRYFASAPKEEAQPSMEDGGVAITFLYGPKNKVSAIAFLKNGELIRQQNIEVGQKVIAPWMGIEVTLLPLPSSDGPEQGPQAIELEALHDVPTSAVEVGIPQSKVSAATSFWLLENSAKTLSSETGGMRVSYTQEIFQLPFEVELIKFEKQDYFKSEMAREYQSLVRVNGKEYMISMNEPLEMAGYTLYQSSYIMQPGSPTYSIFSVNSDPGRWMKYLGSIILSIGIITFTFMRSRFYKKLTQKNRTTT